MSCGAWKFVPGMKLHGCYYKKCEGCGHERCPHWDVCPGCMRQFLESMLDGGCVDEEDWKAWVDAAKKVLGTQK